jgi:hypothetical protein
MKKHISESETDEGVDMHDLITKQREQLQKQRAQGADAGKSKKIKRTIVGIFIGSWGGSIFWGVPYFTTAIMVVGFAMFYEIMNI